METTNKIASTKKINSDILADILNLSATIKGNTNRTAYNYIRIAENLETLNKIMKLNLSEEDIKKIQSDKNTFAAEKTKMRYATNEQYAKIKKDVRKFIQNFKDKNCPFTDDQKNYIINLCK